jgi:hypothetical protein
MERARAFRLASLERSSARFIIRMDDRPSTHMPRVSIARFYGNGYGNSQAVAKLPLSRYFYVGRDQPRDVSCKLTRFQLNRPVLAITPALFYSRPFLFRKHAQPFQPVTIALIRPARSSRRTHADNARGLRGITLIDGRVLPLSISAPRPCVCVTGGTRPASRSGAT